MKERPFPSGLPRATLMAGDDPGGEDADRRSHWKQRTEVLMRLMKKWMMLSLGGGVLVTVAVTVVLLLFADVLMKIVTDVPGPLEAVAKMVFWPVTATLHLVCPGPNIGVPQKNLNEWTPFQYFAAAAGIGLSWVFYSSLAFLIFWLRYLFARSR